MCGITQVECDVTKNPYYKNKHITMVKMYNLFVIGPEGGYFGDKILCKCLVKAWYVNSKKLYHGCQPGDCM